jgi:Glycosyl hydrolases family 39
MPHFTTLPALISLLWTNPIAPPNPVSVEVQPQVRLETSLFPKSTQVMQVAQATSVAVDVNWDRLTGRKATELSYGLNGFQLFSAKAMASATYRENLTAMRPGILRYHNYQMMNDSRTDEYGWMLDPGKATYRWDRNKIATVMANPLSYQPTLMMNIAEWPTYMELPDGKLKPEQYGAFAALVADLVRLVNVEQKRGVKYWEILNEMERRYPNNPAEVAKIYNLVAQAMRQVDPTIKIGGPSFESPYGTNLIESFVAQVHPQLDFLSYHTYTTARKDNSDQELFQAAGALGSEVQKLRSVIAKYTTRPVEIFHDEFNISYAPPDTRMTNQVSAVYDATGLIAITQAGADSSMAWNESDGWYGKLENSFGNWRKRPAAFVYQLFSDHLRGDLVQVKSSYAGITPYAIRAEKHYGMALVNRSGADQWVQLRFTGTNGPVPSRGLLTAYQVDATGLKTTTVVGLSWTGSYRVPKDTVVVLRFDRS